MNKIKFPSSIELFLLVREVANEVFFQEPISDAALGRIIGLESARTSRWKHGQIAVDDAARLVSLSQALGIDLFVLVNVAAGYLDAKEALGIIKNDRKFLRFLGEQIILHRNDYAINLSDSEGSEARLIRQSVTRHDRLFRRSGSIVQVSQKEHVKCILLADDDPNSIDIFSNTTDKDPGIKGVIATNMCEALIKAGEFKPHVIIVDLFLPGADGFLAIRNMASPANLAPARIIGTSNFINQEIIRKAKGCGAEHILERPLRARTIGKLLREFKLG